MVSVTSGHRTTEQGAATPSMWHALLVRFGGCAPGDAVRIFWVVSAIVASLSEGIAFGSFGSLQPSTARLTVYS